MNHLGVLQPRMQSDVKRPVTQNIQERKMLSAKNDSFKFASNTQLVETTLPLPTSDLDEGEMSRMTKGDDTKKSSQRPARSNFLSINSILEQDN